MRSQTYLYAFTTVITHTSIKNGVPGWIRTNGTGCSAANLALNHERPFALPLSYRNVVIQLCSGAYQRDCLHDPDGGLYASILILNQQVSQSHIPLDALTHVLDTTLCCEV